jgi:DNA-binding XRE family transcriptional regulator
VIDLGTHKRPDLEKPLAQLEDRDVERFRLRAALSQIELAKKAGVAPAAVNRIERNRVEPQMRTVRKLAKALEVEPHMLIEGP